MARSTARTGRWLIATAASAAIFFAGAVSAQHDGSAASPGRNDHSLEPGAVASDPLGDFVVDFELTDRDGESVSLGDFLGSYVLLGFGFTHCPHICPLMALNMGKALKATDKPATGIFVSVDTERDSPAVTDDYASRFGDAMIGLGGSIEQINAAASNFKVTYVVTKSQNNYTVQHTANVYLIDPEGNLSDVFTFSTPGETLVEAMR